MGKKFHTKKLQITFCIRFYSSQSVGKVAHWLNFIK